VRRLLGGEAGDAFIADMRAFLPPVVTCGVYNSLSQTLLKLTTPGVPDTYQGSELWNFSLVDPDNRRPVDFAARRHALERLVRRVTEAEAGGALPALLGQMLQAPADGAVKLYLVWRLLGLRRERPALFADAGYQPLTVEGPGAEHLCAFERRLEGEGSLLVLAPRLYFSLTGGGRKLPLGAEAWDETRLVLARPPPGKPCREVLSGQLLRPDERAGRAVFQVERVLEWFPVAALLLEE
jgi:(1->4)-alpha-D-glucan 1-alpha-D-glucosylmutase